MARRRPVSGVKVYVVTEEPYRDNSSLVGVYASESDAIAAVRALRPADWNGSDWKTGPFTNPNVLPGRRHGFWMRCTDISRELEYFVHEETVQ